MKARLIDAGGFVIGVIAACMQGGFVDEFPWPIRLALSLLAPGYFAGLPLVYLAGALGLGSLSFFFIVGTLVNGLIFGLAAHLIRKAMQGQRVSRIALAIFMGVWIAGGAVYVIKAWPWPEHLAPVDLSSPLAGRWKGVYHGQRGDRSIVLICHPRADSTLDGYLYIHDWDMGSLENGVYVRDSLHFEIIGSDYNAHFNHGEMAMVSTGGGMSDRAELRFVSADTSRPAPAPVDLASPLAGRWEGVLPVRSGNRPVVLICHPHTDQALDGYLYITGMDMGQFVEGVWAADSLHFEIEEFQYRAHFDRTTMTMARSGKGINQSIALRFVGADTTRPAVQAGPVSIPIRRHE